MNHTAQACYVHPACYSAKVEGSRSQADEQQQQQQQPLTAAGKVLIWRADVTKSLTALPGVVFVVGNSRGGTEFGGEI